MLARITHTMLAGGLFGLAAVATQGQTVYVDFGTAGGTPTSAFGALEVAGTWNTVSHAVGTTSLHTELLRADSGLATDVSLEIDPSAEVLRTCNECSVPPSIPAGDAAAFFGDDLSIGFLGDVALGSFTTLTFAGLSEGRYRVTVYGRPATVNGGNGFRAWVQDDEVGTTKSLHYPEELAGTFPDSEEGVTFLQFADVTTLNGELAVGFRWSHIPFELGDPFPPIYFDGAFINGIQLVPVPLCADINGDGAVNFADLNDLLEAWGSDNADADIDGSGSVNFEDLNELLDQWATDCPNP